jgi:hypothetical protein
MGVTHGTLRQALWSVVMLWEHQGNSLGYVVVYGSIHEAIWGVNGHVWEHWEALWDGEMPLCGREEIYAA